MGGWGGCSSLCPPLPHISVVRSALPPTEQKRDAFARFIEEVVDFDFWFFSDLWKEVDLEFRR